MVFRSVPSMVSLAAHCHATGQRAIESCLDGRPSGRSAFSPVVKSADLRNWAVHYCKAFPTRGVGLSIQILRPALEKSVCRRPYAVLYEKSRSCASTCLPALG